MTRVQIQPEILSWAADEAGLHLLDFASQLSTRDAEKILKGSLSEAQVFRASKLAKIEFHKLFLKTPPEPQKTALTDFRTLKNKQPLSKEFFDVYNDILYKQEWYKEFLTMEGAISLPFIGLYKDKVDHKEIAKKIREMLALNAKPSFNGFDEYYTFLVQKVEEIGVLVFKNGVVGNNTSRPLDVREFRGFTICDPIAPVIFINGQDASSAWIFTLIHELAHLLRGESGLSDAASMSTRREEILCNKVAAEVLVPEAEFLKNWEELRMTSAEDKLQKLQKFFDVSFIVIARRAYDLGLIPKGLYLQMVHNERGKEIIKSGSGGNFYRTIGVRNSKTLTKIVSGLAASGSLSFREAGRLLQTKPVHIMTIHKASNAISS